MKTKLIVILGLIAAPLMAAQQAPPEPDFAPFGISINWSVRINAVMGAEPRLVPPGPCDGMIQLRFTNDAGEVLAEKTARVSSSAVASFEFVAPPEPERIRPQVSWVQYPPGPCRGNLIANVEVYDNASGRTLFVVPGEQAPPEPEFGPLSIVNNLTARINAMMGPQPHLYPPGPCAGVIQLRFFDGNGNVLAENMARLSADSMASLELVAPPEPDRGGRLAIVPRISWVEVPPGPCRSNLISNVEVYNNETGATLFVTPGN